MYKSKSYLKILGVSMYPLYNPYTEEELKSLTTIAIEVLPDEYDYNASIHNYCLMVPSHMQAPVVRTVLFTRYRQQTQVMKAGYSTTMDRKAKLFFVTAHFSGVRPSSWCPSL